MEKKLNDTGVNKETGIDYFEYARKNPTHGNELVKKSSCELLKKTD